MVDMAVQILPWVTLHLAGAIDSVCYLFRGSVFWFTLRYTLLSTAVCLSPWLPRCESKFKVEIACARVVRSR
jgi:hypothetical protein